MKKILFTGLILLTANVFAEPTTTTYKNTRGSTLKLQINGGNTLTGTFNSAVATKQCPKAIGVDRPITGYIEKNALAFSVNYPGCGVVTFIGNVEDNQKTIDTTAMITHSSDLTTKEGLTVRMLSHDVFTKIS